MDNYFSPSTGLFYSAKLFGARRIMVPDPAWQCPLIEKTTQRPLVEGEDPATIAAYYGDALVGWEALDDVLVITHKEPGDSVTPPLVEIDNPECRLPADAVPVPEQRYRELQAAQSQGLQIGQDEHGNPVAMTQPEPSLAAIKASLSAAITAERDRREAIGFPYHGRVLDSNPLSVQRITAAALGAQAAVATGQVFTVDWTCADNSVLTLDAPAVIGMPLALAQHAAALHAHARTLKAAVDAATYKTALAAIDIQSGWPEL
ncbi:DUF4376 domain-containing protein [Craterilacuibacter sinensis]|nr:DUF4376 domain-containing protein [Craterilacuibacter sinensis]